jgi:hypothetical protein
MTTTSVTYREKNYIGRKITVEGAEIEKEEERESQSLMCLGLFHLRA